MDLPSTCIKVCGCHSPTPGDSTLCGSEAGYSLVHGAARSDALFSADKTAIITKAEGDTAVASLDVYFKVPCLAGNPANHANHESPHFEGRNKMNKLETQKDQHPSIQV